MCVLFRRFVRFNSLEIKENLYSLYICVCMFLTIFQLAQRHRAQQEINEKAKEKKEKSKLHVK